MARKPKRDLTVEEQLARGPLDLPFLMLVLLLLGIGLIMMFSASYATAYYTDGDPLVYISRQALFGAVGVVGMFVVSKINYQTFRWMSMPALIGSIVLLVLVFTPLGVTHNQARRWLKLGIEFQPSEFAKIAVILFFAARLSKRDTEKRKRYKNRTFTGRMLNRLERVGFLELVPYGAILLLVAALMLKQPHMSGTILVLAWGASVLFAAGIHWGWFVTGITGVGGLLWIVITLTPYMTNRINLWLDPWSQRQGLGYQTVQSLIFMGIEHNIRVMHQMGAERQFGNLLEAARSEKDWKSVRAYLNIFREYFTYTNDKQKEQTLGFLYELLMHREGDIRAQAARLLGHVIAQFNAGYRKERPAGMPDIAEERVMEIWKQYLEMIIRPDHKLMLQQKRRIRYHLKNVLASVVDHATPGDLREFLEAFLVWYDRADELDPGEAFSLLDTVHFMPFDKLSEEELGKIAKFALIESQSGEPDVRIASWRAFKLLTAYQPDHPCCAEIGMCVKAAQVEDNITMTFLKYRVLNNLGEDTAREQELLYDRDVVSDIFLDNLKTATPWVIKSANIKLLVDQIAHGKQEHMLHIAAHLSNLVKVSEHVIVRHDAGTALLRIIGLLTPDQRNEIVVELMKGLEVGEYEFSKYIPQYLGQAALWLPPEQLEEIVSYLHGMMANANDQIVSVALDTVGVLLERYSC